MGYVVAIPLLPVLAFAVLAPLSRRLRNKMIWVAVTAVVASLALSVLAFVQTWPGGHADAPVFEGAFEFAHIGPTVLTLGVSLEPVSAVMLLVVAVVGVAVQWYSLGYMHREERIGWYYAVLSLFTGGMFGVVLAGNFLQLYMAWEVMGLCSYLLIGFWHEQEAPRMASLKAFLTTRVGDVGFAIGLAVMYAEVGSFGFADVLVRHEWAPGAATVVALLFLFGAMGKSAQFPLHVWLPDAMAGPTPASALIHAATMVAAGVYLVVRAYPVFEASGVALTVTLVVGLVTALAAGLVACVQHDIKKVLAYSTISQLGYMFVALGAGGATAGLYHLVTHAYFKSLLFLGAGVIIHAAHTQDMREMGGLARYLPKTTTAFTAGALALAGIAPFSGFWSKDEILTVLYHQHQYVALVFALIAAFVTAFYVARLWFRVFTGPAQTDDLHEGHASMLLPMGMLATITTLIGFFGPALGQFLGHEMPLPALPMALTSTGVALAGIALGWFVYGRRTRGVNTRAIKERLSYVYGVLENKLYLDLTYDYFFIKPYERLASALSAFDANVIDGVVNGAGIAWRRFASGGWTFDATVIDGLVNGTAAIIKEAGLSMRRLQSGRVRGYQMLVIGAVVLLMVWVLVKGA